MDKVKGGAFKFESSRSQITFKEKGLATKLRINQLLYKTASANNLNILIIVSGWKTDKSYNDIYYSRMQTLPRVTLAEVNYENDSGVWHVIKNQPTDISTHIVELYINGDTTNTDISPSNPIFIEFDYELI